MFNPFKKGGGNRRKNALEKILEDFAQMAGIESVVIGENTTVGEIKKELRWNEVYYFISRGYT